jgi:hypothetical protein
LFTLATVEDLDNRKKTNHYEKLRLSRLAAIGEVVVCTLPAQIGELKNLRYIGLEGNKFSKEEQERIRKLLPECWVKF